MANAFAGGVAVIRAVGTSLVLLTSLGLGTAAALAQPYPPVEAVATCESTAVGVGESVDCEGAGFAPGSDVVVEAVDPTGQPSFTTTVQADDDGIARASIAIAASAQPGTHEVVFVGLAPEGGEATGTHTIQVRTDPVEEPDERSLLPILLILLLVVLGVGAALLAWRQYSGRAPTP